MQSRSKIMTVSLVALALSPATTNASEPTVVDASRERGSALSTSAPTCAALAATRRRGAARGGRLAGGLLPVMPRPYRKG